LKKSYKHLYFIVALVITCAFLLFYIIHQQANHNEVLKNLEVNEKGFKKLTSEYTDLRIKYDKIRMSSQMTEKEKVSEKLALDFFETLFNYDNDNFVSRFKKAEKITTKKIIENIKGAGEVTSPRAKVEKRITNIDIFKQIEKKNEMFLLIQLDSIYSVDGEQNPEMKELYKIKVNIEEEKVTHFEFLGNLNLIEHS